MSTLKGTVKWFNGKKGFGFIEREDKEKDAFVHASAVKAAGMRYLNEGDKLEFTLEDGPKGPAAVNLKKVDYTLFNSYFFYKYILYLYILKKYNLRIKNTKLFNYTNFGE